MTEAEHVLRAMAGDYRCAYCEKLYKIGVSIGICSEQCLADFHAAGSDERRRKAAEWASKRGM